MNSSDKQIIKRLGGPSAVAKMLNLDMSKGPQRVHNWTKRGIPAQVKLEHPGLFMPNKKAA